MQLSRKIGTIRSLTAFPAWLFTVVRRECTRLACVLRLHPPQSLAELDLERSFGARPQAELALDIAAAIEALPPHYRELLLLRDLREMTNDEISTNLGGTRQAIKAKLRRGRLLVREYLRLKRSLVRDMRPDPNRGSVLSDRMTVRGAPKVATAS